MIGKVISHYRIIDRIGAGGMGEVYRAHDEQLDRDIALKILPVGMLADEAARKQFRKEALALAKLNHPNIETVHEFGSQDGVDFLAMELIPGQSLGARIKEGPLAEREIVRLGMHLAEGLAAAHDQGIIHRDLKPGNLFVTPDGRLKILDFGLARLIHPDLANDVTRSLTVESGTVSGTVPYMPPEQLRGEPTDARSDIYSAGAVLYEMAAGQRPFPQTQGPQLMGAILHKAPVPLSAAGSHVSPGLESVILKALEKEASQRYQTARELRVALEGVTSSSSGATATAPAAAPSAILTAQPIHWRWKIFAPAALLFVVALGIVGWLYYARRSHALTEKDTIVLADFTNTTGDAVFDGTLREGLSVELEQSPFLSLVSEAQIQQSLRLMGDPADAHLTPQIARELCQRTGATAVLDGSIAQIGTQYLLTLKAVNCANGQSLASTEAQASDKNHILDALGKVSVEIRNKLGESLATVQKFDVPLVQATTPSLEALKAFSMGQNSLYRKADFAAGVPFFQRAISLDPNFAMAYASLGNDYFYLGEGELASENERRGYELRNRVSEQERFYIEGHYYYHVTGDLGKACQVFELWTQTYPRDWFPLNQLGLIYRILGQYDKSLTTLREVLPLAPENAISYTPVVSAYVDLNRLDEAKATAEEAQSKKLDSAFLREHLYVIAFLQNDAVGMAQEVAWAQGKPGVEDALLAAEADTAAYSGRLKRAREFSLRAVTSAERAEQKEGAAGDEAAAALREALFGNATEARHRATAALSHSKGRDVQYGAALALAFAGDIRAQALSNDLAMRFPESTLVQFSYLPTLRAEVALIGKEASKAIEVLQITAPYELGENGGLYPVYVRGQAYLAMRQGTQAAAEFQKILDHRGVVNNEPVGALAHLGLARASALEGDTAKARDKYQDFLSLWKDADPDIPILIAAKAEYAKLK